MKMKHDDFLRLRIPSELKKRLDDHCWKNRISMSEFIRNRIEELSEAADSLEKDRNQD